MLQLASGSDSVLACSVDPALPPSSIALSPAQAYNLRTAAGQKEEFTLFSPPDAEQPWGLAELEAEVSVLGRAPEDGSAIELDAPALAAAAQRQLLGQVAAVGEAVIVPHGGHRVLLRVAATQNLEAEAAAEAIGRWCFRGLVTPDTRLWLVPSPGTPAAAAASAAAAAAEPAAQSSSAEGSSGADTHSGGGGGSSSSTPQSLLASRARVSLLNARPRPPPGSSARLLEVLTNDGECFPVHRRLLRPCIALTRALRDEAACEAPVDVSTSAFDRVLLFLEALALGREPPAWGVHLLPELKEAAAKLGLRPLEEHCEARLSGAEARLRVYSFEEIKQLNNEGGCVLIIDGMVLDVKRWLPEHPGGSQIIPRQSLNIDSARQFELYHASRDSFLFLQQFYLGELDPADRLEGCPPPSPPPSADFLAQLRQFTPWRMRVEGVCRNL